MIFVDNRFWPLAGSSSYWMNTLLVSPQTGEVWARIDRGRGEWFPCRAPRAADKPWPLPESIPGSLASDYDDWRWRAFDELSRPLLLREIALLERWTSATLLAYNGSTQLPPETLTVNPSLMQDIAALRAKEAAGTITDEELRAVLRKMREGRVTAYTVSSASRAKVAAAKPNTDAAAAALRTLFKTSA